MSLPTRDIILKAFSDNLFDSDIREACIETNECNISAELIGMLAILARLRDLRKEAEYGCIGDEFLLMAEIHADVAATLDNARRGLLEAFSE